jgi:hypothetical protein
MTLTSRFAGVLFAAGASISAASAQAPTAGEFQYAAKFVCGTTTQSTLVQPGQYRTTVNIHNPGTQGVLIRYKTAVAAVGQSGKVSGFNFTDIGPDAVMNFDCGTILKLLNFNLTTLNEGFFVIESAAQLDVTAVYTAGPNATQVASVDVEAIAKRDIRARQCRRNFSMDLTDPALWMVGWGGAAVTVPASTIYFWDSGRSWIGESAGAIGATQDYFFTLRFCSCSTSGGRVTGGNVKTDNGAKGEVQTGAGMVLALFNTGYVTPPSSNHNGNYAPSAAAVNLSTTAFALYGDGWVSVIIGNDTGPVGMSFSSTSRLVLDYGYAGPCTD